MPLSVIPSSATAGESLDIALSLPEYSGWTVQWIAQGRAALRVHAPLAEHSGLFSGQLNLENLLSACPWQLWAEKNGEKRLIKSGVIEVKSGLFTFTQEEKILTALQDALLRLAQDDEAEVWIFERKIVFKDMQKLQNMIDIYQRKVDAQRGKSPFTLIPVRLR